MRIGILGGTFNPIHNGHIKIAQEAYKRLKLDKVIFMPAYIPPHKEASELVNAEDRLKMVEIAITGKEGFGASRYEIDKEGKSYTVETIKYLKKAYPADTEFLFLMGADSLQSFDFWKDKEEMLSLCKFVVFNRRHFAVKAKYANIINCIDIDPIDISSTDIRKSVKENKTIAELVPGAVAAYIKYKNLYK
jgi:nicotinate-nucleotide adenylyltransferase